MKIRNVSVGLAILISIGMLALGACTHVVAEGEKVGTVIKISQQGVLCKTWEGEMVRGGMNGGSGAFSTTPLHFTINDPNLLRESQAALEGQYEVKVHYVGYLGPFMCASDSMHYTFLTRIERLR